MSEVRITGAELRPGPTEPAKQFIIPGLRELARGVTQPRTIFFGHLCNPSPVQIERGTAAVIGAESDVSCPGLGRTLARLVMPAALADDAGRDRKREGRIGGDEIPSSHVQRKHLSRSREIRRDCNRLSSYNISALAEAYEFHC